MSVRTGRGTTTSGLRRGRNPRGGLCRGAAVRWIRDVPRSLAAHAAAAGERRQTEAAHNPLSDGMVQGRSPEPPRSWPRAHPRPSACGPVPGERFTRRDRTRGVHARDSPERSPPQAVAAELAASPSRLHVALGSRSIPRPQNAQRRTRCNRSSTAATEPQREPRLRREPGQPVGGRPLPGPGPPVPEWRLPGTARCRWASGVGGAVPQLTGAAVPAG